MTRIVAVGAAMTETRPCRRSLTEILLGDAHLRDPNGVTVGDTVLDWLWSAVAGLFFSDCDDVLAGKCG